MNSLDRPFADPPYPDEEQYLDEEPSIFRQNLRSRLREKEQKLTDMIRASRGNSSVGMQGMRGGPLMDVSSAEDVSLSQDVRRVRSSDNSDILDKISGLEQVSAQQSSRIESLEKTLSNKNVEVDELRSELVKKLEKIVTLELELESRAISLDANLDTVSELELGSLSNEFDLASKLSPGQAQMFASQLLKDLRELELLYKEERVKSSLLQDQLRQENEFLQNTIAKRLADLDSRLQNNEDERSRLTEAVATRNQEIEALKRELATLRLIAISEGNVNDPIFSEFDADLLRTTTRSIEPTRAQGEEAPMELQLRDANLRLVRKDQQEAIERAMQNFSREGSLRQLALLQRAKATSAPEEQLDVTADTDESFDTPLDSPSRSPLRVSRRSLRQDQELAIERAKASSARLGPRSGRSSVPSKAPTEDTSRSTASRSSQRSSRRVVREEQEKAINRARTLFGRFRLGGGTRGGRFTI